MASLLATFASCLNSVSLNFNSARCRALLAFERAVERTVIFVAAAVKIGRSPSPISPPLPPTKTAPMLLPTSPTELYQAPASFSLICILLFGIFLLSICTTLHKSGILLTAIKGTSTPLKAFAGTSKRYSFSIFVLLPLFIAGDIIQFYSNHVALHAWLKKGRIRRASLLFWRSPGTIWLLLKSYGRIVGGLVAQTPRYGSILDIYASPLPNPSFLLHPDVSWYNIPEMLRTALPGRNVFVDVWTTRRSFWGSNEWRPILHAAAVDPNLLRLVGGLGAGGFGTVVKARYEQTVVAIKKVPKGRPGLRSKWAWDSFRWEVLVHSLMAGHPAFPSLHGVFHGPEDFFLVMECGGQSLVDVDPFSRGRVEALAYLGQTILALHALHKKGVVHGDLKPDNLVLDSNGNVLIIDYGIALVFDDLPDVTQYPLWHALRDADGDTFPILWTEAANPDTRRIRGGTPGYISPSAGPNFELPCSYGADFYALGVMAHEWLTGVLPDVSTGSWVPDPAHGLSNIDIDFVRGLLTVDGPIRFEDYEDLKGHPVWADMPSWEELAGLYYDLA
ncbi:kinase-like domain-containing protein [Mycena rosella]|uniref:non-specific serine/threonine protein kinase n=1 Tax=Mycena rosella TaxID=1033263 RepID=A0AAD7CVX7_MYCRO|nr:kinase-like domain-containing protein [Mycena rosella]